MKIRSERFNEIYAVFPVHWRSGALFSTIKKKRAKDFLKRLAQEDVDNMGGLRTFKESYAIIKTEYEIIAIDIQQISDEPFILVSRKTFKKRKDADKP